MIKKQIYLTILLALTITIGYSQKELQVEYSVTNCEYSSASTKYAILKASPSKVIFKETERYLEVLHLTVR